MIVGKKIVLLLVTASWCPFSNNYKNDEENGLKALKKELNYSVTKFIEVIDPRKEWPKNIPTQLMDVMNKCPDLIVVPYNNFYECLLNKNTIINYTDCPANKHITHVVSFIKNHTKLSKQEKYYITKLLCLLKYEAKNLENKKLNSFIPKYILLYHIMPYLIDDFVYIL